MDDAAAVLRPVERVHGTVERQLARFPHHLQLLELLQKDVAATGRRGSCERTRDIGRPEKRPGECRLRFAGGCVSCRFLPSFERVQIDRGRCDKRRQLRCAEDQVLAIRRPRKPARPNPMAPAVTLRPGLEQTLLGTAKRRRHRRESHALPLRTADERDALTVGRPRWRMVGRRIRRQTRLRAAIDRSGRRYRSCLRPHPPTRRRPRSLLERLRDRAPIPGSL